VGGEERGGRLAGCIYIYIYIYIYQVHINLPAWTYSRHLLRGDVPVPPECMRVCLCMCVFVFVYCVFAYVCMHVCARVFRRVCALHVFVT